MALAGLPGVVVTSPTLGDDETALAVEKILRRIAGLHETPFAVDTLAKLDRQLSRCSCGSWVIVTRPCRTCLTLEAVA